MEINKEKKVVIRLTKEDVKDALIGYLTSLGHIPVDDKVDNDSIVMTDLKKTVASPGADIHDCYYDEYFDGIEFIYKTI
jgi:hypothetical protein